MGSVFHVTGLSRLLHTCGPEAFYQQPLRSAFESCRATLVSFILVIVFKCLHAKNITGYHGLDIQAKELP